VYDYTYDLLPIWRETKYAFDFSGNIMYNNMMFPEKSITYFISRQMGSKSYMESYTESYDSDSDSSQVYKTAERRIQVSK
jgi:hypothetical protein